MLFRAYLLLKLFRHYTKWTSVASKRACDEYETEASTMFAIKACLKDKPFHFLIPLILVSIVVFSTAVRLFERGFSLGTSQQDYSYIWNSMWLVMLTMTTVGYGDFFPRTHLGRFIIVLACFWGIFLISLMVVTLTSFILFSNEESRSFDYMAKVKNLNNSKKFATLYIKTQLERYYYYKKHKKDGQFIENLARFNSLLKFFFKKFKEYETQAKFADVGAEEMLIVLNERISTQVKLIHKNLHIAHAVHENLTKAITSQEKTKESLEHSIKVLQELKRLFIN